MASDERWVGVEDVAAHLGVAKDSIYRRIEDRVCPPAELDGFCGSRSPRWMIGSRQGAERAHRNPSPCTGRTREHRRRGAPDERQHPFTQGSTGPHRLYV